MLAALGIANAPPTAPMPAADLVTVTPAHLAHARGALARAVAAVRGAASGARNATLTREARGLGNLIAAGTLDKPEVLDRLVEAGQAAGLPEAEARDVARRGIEAGERTPRNLAAVGAGERNDEPRGERADAKGAEPVRALFDSWPSVRRFAAKPEPFEMLFDGFIKHRTVGALLGTDGVGKSFLLLRIAASIASGQPFGPFVPTRPRKILALCAEDDLEVLHERAHAILDAAGLADDETTAGNFGLDTLTGGNCALVIPDPRGTLTPSDTYRRLDAALAVHKPEVLMLDPLSRLYAGNENDNNPATAFVAMLEALAVRHGCTVWFSHHTPKADKEKSLAEAVGRGASAFKAACRFTFACGLLDEKQADALDIPEADRFDYLALAVVKGSYTRRQATAWHFKRNADGVPEPVNLRSARVRRNAELLRDLLADLAEPLTRRQLARPEGKGILAALKAAAPGFIVRRDLDPALDCALREGLLVERDRETGPKRTRVRVLLDPLAEGDAA